MRHYTSSVPGHNMVSMSYSSLEETSVTYCESSLRIIHRKMCNAMELDTLASDEFWDALVRKHSLTCYSSKVLSPNECRVINDLIAFLYQLHVDRRSYLFVYHNVNEGHSVVAMCD